MKKKTSSSMMSLEESMVLQHWRGIRAMNNRFDSWDSADSNHNQVSYSLFFGYFFFHFTHIKLNTGPNLNLLLQCTAALTTKSIDKWEVPRHHVKVFNILGEGCFGQVWKCEALGIDSK